MSESLEALRAKNREKAARHRAKNKDAINKAYRERYANDPTPRLKAHAEYRERRREELLARRRELYAENRASELEKAREYREGNRAEINRRAREYYQANREKILKSERKARGKRTAAHREKKYGVSEAQFNAMRSAQGDKCAICEADFSALTTRDVHIDHCHDTGAVRGLLCRRCNHALGLLLDNVASLKRAITYLEDQPFAIDKPVG